MLAEPGGGNATLACETVCRMAIPLNTTHTGGSSPPSTATPSRWRRPTECRSTGVIHSVAPS
eukprot:scaffold33360_cov94-Phaeocystis_antarctica.AAC.1